MKHWHVQQNGSTLSSFKHQSENLFNLESIDGICVVEEFVEYRTLRVKRGIQEVRISPKIRALFNVVFSRELHSPMHFSAIRPHLPVEVVMAFMYR